MAFPDLGASSLSSDLRSLVSSFILCTAALRLSFSSSSDSRKAFRSMAAFRRDSKSSTEARVLLLALSRSSFCCSRSRTYLLSWSLIVLMSLSSDWRSVTWKFIGIGKKNFKHSCFQFAY